MTGIFAVLYAIACVVWAKYLTKDLKPLRNWQWLLSWTVFLPLVAVGLIFAALGALKDWLVGEA